MKRRNGEERGDETSGKEDRGQGEDGKRDTAETQEQCYKPTPIIFAMTDTHITR